MAWSDAARAAALAARRAHLRAHVAKSRAKGMVTIEVPRKKSYKKFQVTRHQYAKALVAARKNPAVRHGSKYGIHAYARYELSVRKGLRK